MTTTLRPRTFKAYAVVEALRSGSEDIRGAVVPFFHPLLAFKNGSTLNTAQLADAANEAYAWNLSSDVVEALLPQFIEHGWVQPIETNERTSVYRVTCHLPDGAFYSKLTEELKRLETDFCAYTEDRSPLFVGERTREDLLSLLLRWVVSLDVYDFEQLRKTADSLETEPQDVLEPHAHMPKTTSTSRPPSAPTRTCLSRTLPAFAATAPSPGSAAAPGARSAGGVSRRG